MNQKSHLEIILLPGEHPNWVFKFTNKGLSQLRHGKMFEKKFTGGAGSMTFNFCNEEQFKKQFEPKLRAIQKRLDLEAKLKAEIEAGEKAMGEEKQNDESNNSES